MRSNARFVGTFHANTKKALEMILQVHAAAEKFNVVGLESARYLFASVNPHIRHVTAQRVPNNTAIILKGIEPDPAPLETQRHRLRKRVIHTEQDLESKERGAEDGLSNADRSGEVVTDLLNII